MSEADLPSFYDEMQRCGYRQAFVNITGRTEIAGYRFYYVEPDVFYQLDADAVTPGQHKCWEDYI